VRNRTRLMIVPLGLITTLAFGASCKKKGPTAPTLTLPANIESILTTTHSDPTGDQVLAPFDGPPAVVQYPPADLVSIRLGVSGSILYMRVTFAGVIPGAPVQLPAQGAMPVQIVKDQGMSLNLDIDNNETTGAGGWPVIGGIDIFFAVRFVYGANAMAYVNYDFPSGDVHANRGHIEGTIVEGGPGSDRVTLAFDVSTLSAFLPRGRTVNMGAWSEAQSYRQDGSLLYHHFAYDPTVAERWTIPQ
jgi:hypothetical protein